VNESTLAERRERRRAHLRREIWLCHERLRELQGQLGCDPAQARANRQWLDHLHRQLRHTNAAEAAANLSGSP